MPRTLHTRAGRTGLGNRIGAAMAVAVAVGALCAAAFKVASGQRGTRLSSGVSVGTAVHRLTRTALPLRTASPGRSNAYGERTLDQPLPDHPPGRRVDPELTMVGNANLFNTLRPGQPVEAEVWDGQIVLARTADGGTMPTEYEPRHAADQDFLWAVLWGSFSLLVAAATGGIRYHERQRRLRRAARRRLAASQERHPA